MKVDRMARPQARVLLNAVITWAVGCGRRGWLGNAGGTMICKSAKVKF